MDAEITARLQHIVNQRNEHADREALFAGAAQSLQQQLAAEQEAHAATRARLQEVEGKAATALAEFEKLKTRAASKTRPHKAATRR